MSEPVRLALVGLGKIARDQHLPAILADARFELAATVSPADLGVRGVAHFETLDELLASGLPLHGVTLCTPPQVRHELAATTLGRGLHVLLEKPPAASVQQVDALARQAGDAALTLFTSWHSRHAAGVAAARDHLQVQKPIGARITWREDVRKWHPGQAWIWREGGLGVFDPGINALSILTHIWPRPLHLVDAKLSIPANRAMPIAAELKLVDPDGAEVEIDFDWRESGPQIWTVDVATHAGALVLSEGGAQLQVQDRVHSGPDREYPALYAHFADLIVRRVSDVDIRPLGLVAQALLHGDRLMVAPFVE